MKFAFIKECLAEHPVRLSCEVLGVSDSGYYAWLVRPQSERARWRDEMAEKVATVHEQNRRVYGSPRAHAALAASGESVCVNTVAKVMKGLGIKAKSKKKYVPSTTNSSHQQPAVGNVLDRQFESDRPNQKWAVDITYIPTGQGWLYMAGVIDLCSRK